MSKAQSDYIDRAISAGCLVCALQQKPEVPAVWHHQKEGYHGGGMRAPHEQGVALCYEHHVGTRGIHTYRHKWRRDAGMRETDLVALSQKLFDWKPEVCNT